MENPTLPPEGRAKLRERHRQERDAIDAFVISAQTGDAARFEKSFELMDLSGTWRRAFRALIRSGQVDDSIKPVFTEAWLRTGDRMSGQVGDVLVFVSALRLFLPAYEGPALKLLRGDSFWNWELRSYGASWSADRDVAKSDALQAWRVRLGGSVILQASAPPEAIVFAPASGHANEQRHVVDRRLLHEVTMVERLPDATIADLANQRSARATSAGSTPNATEGASRMAAQPARVNAAPAY
jgi:hypothetical protein